MLSRYVESFIEPKCMDDYLTDTLLEVAREADFRIGGYAEMDRLDGLEGEVNVVDGLAVVYGGLTNVKIDLPEGGRMTISNPEKYLEIPRLVIAHLTPRPDKVD